ncbi:MAG: M15 family metallopeptidase [Caulobacter sp.]|nr:M15 family metallopeptidase [Caulobacter sp.]
MKIIFFAVLAWAVVMLGVAWFAPTQPVTATSGAAVSSAQEVALAAPASVFSARTVNRAPVEACEDAPAFTAAADRNAIDIDTLDWTPYGPQETGWRTYAPRIAVEIASGCGYDSPGFANALAGWQRAQGRPATGVLDPDSFELMKVRWHLMRPFVILNREVGCPPAPAADQLVVVRPGEAYGARPISLRADALAAYRRMVADARAELPSLARDRQALLIFSGFRSPLENDITCLERGGCDNITRAPCSAHRTGLALDIVVGAARGGRVDSTDNANRLAQSQTAAYRWLVRNAHRYGFVNYVFEPWHWEWSPPEQAGASRA